MYEWVELKVGLKQKEGDGAWPFMRLELYLAI